MNIGHGGRALKGLDRLTGDPRIKDHWMSRGAAFIVDYAIIFVIDIILGIIAGFAITMTLTSVLDQGTYSEWIQTVIIIILIFSFIVFLITVLYWVILDARGGTFGKRILKLKIVAVDGEMSYKKAAVRNLSKIIGAVFVMFLGIIFGSLVLAFILFLDILFGLNKEGDPRQRFFDRKAGTTVIRTLVAEDFVVPPAPVPAPPGPLTAQVPPTVPSSLTPMAEGKGTEDIDTIDAPKIGEPLPDEEKIEGEKVPLLQEQPPARAPSPKAKKLPVVPVVIIIAIVGIIIAAVAVSGVLSGGEKESDKGSGDELFEEVTLWEDLETIEGDISGGGPMTFVPDERVNFEVEDTVIQIDIILTWNPQDMDLDLSIEDPSGDAVGSSGNAPGEPEAVRIKSNIEPGTWTAVIDPWAAINVHYTLEITYYHQSGNTTAGGDILYQKVKTLLEESGDETDTFDVGEGYEDLLIQVEISSGAGDLSIDIKDSDGNEVYSIEVSGEGQESDQETVDAKEGEWEVNYSFNNFTGTIVVTVAGP